ncbi:hypothetical protein XA68_10040 [Ophiocordyceps unilateralis]|uniref:RRM domain-containing protein n=1 Tax=Ophiocordyceps unilateralis TaxID=268505 RepID=A0A2A9PQU6_OPHUN|nr:hypothetical protein XA68_10040 [Ophiocordyceps unilateralis]
MNYSGVNRWLARMPATLDGFDSPDGSEESSSEVGTVYADHESNAQVDSINNIPDATIVADNETEMESVTLVEEEEDEDEDEDSIALGEMVPLPLTLAGSRLNPRPSTMTNTLKGLVEHMRGILVRRDEHPGMLRIAAGRAHWQAEWEFNHDAARLALQIREVASLLSPVMVWPETVVSRLLDLVHEMVPDLSYRDEPERVYEVWSSDQVSMWDNDNGSARHSVDEADRSDGLTPWQDEGPPPPVIDYSTSPAHQSLWPTGDSTILDEDEVQDDEDEVRYDEDDEVPYDEDDEVPYDEDDEVPYDEDDEVPYDEDDEVPYEEDDEVPYEEDDELPPWSPVQSDYSASNIAPAPLEDPFTNEQAPSSPTDILCDNGDALFNDDLNARFPHLRPVRVSGPVDETSEHLHAAPGYHQDVVEMPWPRLFMGSPPAPDGEKAISRRVVIRNLPPDTSAAQVLRAVCRGEGVVAASTHPDLGARPDHAAKAAELIFVHADQAEQFVRHFRMRPVFFLAQDRTRYQAEAWLVPTPTWPNSRERDWLEAGFTRAFSLPNMDVGAVWRAVSIAGIPFISGVRYDERREGVLTIEMTSVCEAVRAHDAIRSALGHRGWYCDQAWWNSAECIHDERELVIQHVDSTELVRAWNRAPYNRLDTAEEVQQPQADDGPAPEATPRRTRALAETLDVSPSQLSSYLAERENNFQDVEYKVIGSTIKLTRRAWSWSVSADDDLKLLMHNTLHEPDWEDEWDRHFEAHGSINLRTWERYGMLAQHRRKRAAEMGLEEWRVPPCNGTCPWGCQDLKDASVPEVVKQYLNNSR